MKLKLVENLPESLVATLKALGHDVDNVTAGRADADVWQAAQKAERFLITQDLDFSDIRKFSPGTHHGLMLNAQVLCRDQTLLDQTEPPTNHENGFHVNTRRLHHQKPGQCHTLPGFHCGDAALTSLAESRRQNPANQC